MYWWYMHAVTHISSRSDLKDRITFYAKKKRKNPRDNINSGIESTLNWIEQFNSLTIGATQKACLKILQKIQSTWIDFSVQFNPSVVSDSLWPSGLQHARLPCPSPTPRACSNSCPSDSRWCHPTTSSSVTPFSCLQSFPASGSFPVSQCFSPGDQSIETSASVLPMNIQDWFL